MCVCVHEHFPSAERARTTPSSPFLAESAVISPVTNATVHLYSTCLCKGIHRSALWGGVGRIRSWWYKKKMKKKKGAGDGGGRIDLMAMDGDEIPTPFFSSSSGEKKKKKEERDRDYPWLRITYLAKGKKSPCVGVAQMRGGNFYLFHFYPISPLPPIKKQNKNVFPKKKIFNFFFFKKEKRKLVSMMGRGFVSVRETLAAASADIVTRQNFRLNIFPFFFFF